MKESELLEKFRSQFRTLLEKTGLLSINSYIEEANRNNRKIDLLIKLHSQSNQLFTVLVEAKTSAYPQNVRMAVEQLKSSLSESNQEYGLLAAPYLSEESRQLCRNAGINYLDLAGNCWLAVDNVFIEVDGKPNPYPEKRPLRSVFSPKSTRLLRVLLNESKKSWYVKDLAKEANLSLGQVSKLKNRLLDYDYLEETSDRKLRFRRAESLLRKWSDKYSYTENQVSTFYTMLDFKDIEQDIRLAAEANRMEYAFTMNSGAIRVAPFVRDNVVFAYINRDISELSKDLDLKEVESGANVMLMNPYDEGVFYYKQQIDNAWVVSDVQLFLDLNRYKKRGEEAAEFIMKERLQPRW